MRPYEVYMHVALLDSMPKNGSQRAMVMKFIRSLREHPDTVGDYIDKDGSLRERQIKIVGSYAITYWADVPVRTVMIVNIQPAD